MADNSGTISGRIWSSKNACILVEQYKPYHTSLVAKETHDELKKFAWEQITRNYNCSAEVKRTQKEIEEKLFEITMNTVTYATLLIKQLTISSGRVNPSEEVLKMYHIYYMGDDQRGGGAGVDAARNAPVQSQQQQQRNAVQCSYCGVHKHKVEQCWKLEDAEKEWLNNRENRENPPCGHCGQIGHIRVNCRLFQAAQQKLNGQEPISIEQATANGPMSGMANVTGTLAIRQQQQPKK